MKTNQHNQDVLISVNMDTMRGWAKYLADTRIVGDETLGVLAERVDVLHVGTDSKDLLLCCAQDVECLFCFFHLVLDANLKLLVDDGLFADELLAERDEGRQVIWVFEHG